MQVPWNTLETIAATEAIDLWYLFPVIAVSRLLRNDGQIDETIRNSLNVLFGDDSWIDEFYRPSPQLPLFEDLSSVVKTANWRAISSYLIKRLETIFAGVASNPRLLKNSNNVPLYLLCFAASNKNGARIALRIAEHILKG